ncbi:MAG: serine/threonine-protein kinase, partial [Polyangia bacterium]|nr:serine/threonine-protein kinase [Polyangia bacterium]
MQCPRCGARVPEEFPICGSCGYDLTNPGIPAHAPGGTDPFRGGMKTERAAEISGQFDLRPGVAVMPGGGEVSTPSGLLYKPGDVILERYEVDQVIGEGPVGVVYSALDRDTDVQVALKIVLPEYFPNRASLRRFQEWMEPARDLQHENIVRVYEVAPLSGRFAIVQQMIVGRSLAEVLAGRLPQGIASPRNEVGALLAQMGEALTYAHPDRVHGGLKPENVLILPAGLVITDFGLALALDSRAYLSGHRHRRLPTRYLAPELQTGDAIDHRADIFSLAVMGFELLVGIPFPGQADRIGDALERLPGQAREALRAALSERPGDRPQTVDDLVDGLLSAVSERTPTSPPARPGNTNVLDIEDLETVEDEGDFPEEATPENLLPAHLDHAAHGRGTPDDGGDTDPRAILPKAPSDYPGKAALPTPGRPRSKGQRAAPSLGFTLEP